MTLRRLLLFAGLVLFVIEALAAWDVLRGFSLATNLGLVGAGLACWIAAALP